MIFEPGPEDVTPAKMAGDVLDVLGVPDLADLLPPNSLEGLGQVITAHWARTIARGVLLAGAATDVDPRELMRREAVKLLMASAGERVKDIEETTRDRVREYVGLARRDRMTAPELAKLIQSDPSGAFQPWRARTIARTETGTAYNRATLAGYAASGRVTEVEVFDGDGCGWTGHGDPDQADGSTRTLAEANAHPLAHPNCQRAFAPVVAGVGAGTGTSNEDS